MFGDIQTRPSDHVQRLQTRSVLEHVTIEFLKFTVSQLHLNCSLSFAKTQTVIVRVVQIIMLFFMGYHQKSFYRLFR